MKIISFDVGIKNMAYCIFDISGSQISIDSWNVLNLIETESIEKVHCNCYNKAKNKKTPAKICGKIAKFSKENQTFCEKHAKTDENYIVPEKRFSPTQLKKAKNELLFNICKEFHIDISNNSLKTDILNQMFSFFNEKCLVPIQIKKTKTANQIDLIHIGKQMKIALNQIPRIEEITHVLIENQISPIANRMKTIQGMLAQYFIMKIENPIHIEFISSANKLRELSIESSNDDSKTQNAKYKEHKKDGIQLCSQYLEKNPRFHSWKYILETKKKDDLADCFLQGMWYIHKKNMDPLK